MFCFWKYQKRDNLSWDIYAFNMFLYIFWIIRNYCFLAFLRKVVVNYASNLICIRLSNCSIFWKQREFLHGLNNLQKLVSVGAIRRFVSSCFANQNFSRDRKAALLRKWFALVLYVKFHFMVCLVKANALASGNG